MFQLPSEMGRQMKGRSFVVLLAVLLAGVGLVIEAQRAGQPQAAPGTVMGRVVFEGTPVKPKPLRMESDPLCMPVKGAQSETLVVDPTGGVRYSFVYVKEGLGNKTFPTPTTPVSLDQKGCLYIPHVFGVQVGQPVSITNSDPAIHNVHTQPKVNTSFNLIQPARVRSATRTFAKPEIMVPIRCDVHPWMTSWAGVVNHPFYAVTQPDGRFEIKGLPPGAYTLEAWHEELGTATQKVTVDAKKGASVNFSFKAPKR